MEADLWIEPRAWLARRSSRRGGIRRQANASADPHTVVSFGLSLRSTWGPAVSSGRSIYPLAILIDRILPIGPHVGLEFFERVGSDDKLYDFIVEADSVKAVEKSRKNRTRKVRAAALRLV
jgi:hypothetical protein